MAAMKTELTASDFDYIRITTADIYGTARGKIIPTRYYKTFLEEGLQLYSGVVGIGPGVELLPFKEIPFGGNVVMKAQPDTLRRVSWSTRGKYSVGEVLCETYWPDGRPQTVCPRYIARRQLDKLSELGYSLKSAFECEFVLDDGKEKSELFNNTVLSKYETLLYDLESALVTFGVDTERLQFECAQNQFEMALNAAIGIEAADMTFRFKAATKEICTQNGSVANFMGKHHIDQIASGFHFNHSIIDENGKNAMFDGDKTDNLSIIARQWIAGLLKHADALTAICSPTVNCYRRMHQPWAPHFADWGIDNRHASIRVMNTSMKRTYVENRIPSAACNPYLVLAVTVAAGMDGIKHKLECPIELNKKQDKHGPELPHDLPGALEKLRADDVIMDCLGEEFVRWFSRLKSEVEIECLKIDDDEERFAKERDMYMTAV